VFFSLVPGVLQLWVFLFPILNVFVVGDSELEEAAAVVGVCVFFCILNVVALGES